MNVNEIKVSVGDYVCYHESQTEKHKGDVTGVFDHVFMMENQYGRTVAVQKNALAMGRGLTGSCEIIIRATDKKPVVAMWD